MSRKRAEFVEEGYAITVTGRHLHVTDAMKDYAIEKISKLEKFGIRIIDVNVVMDIQNLQHHVEFILKVNNINIKSSAVSPDMYRSIDEAVDKLKRQIEKYKGKLLSHHHHVPGLKEFHMNVSVVRPQVDDVEEINDEIEEETRKKLSKDLGSHKVVSQETRHLPELSMGDAIMQLELSGDAFLVYKNGADKSIKVMYRRSDGNFGIIEPDNGHHK
jgi:putative sigma-54 modulation protein